MEGSESWKTETMEEIKPVPFDQIAAKMEATEPQKRKPGRPKKEVTQAAGSVGEDSQSSKTKSPFGSPSQTGINPQQGASVGAAPAFGTISSGIPHEAIRMGLELPFAIAASQTGFAGFALQKEESEPLIPQVDYVIARYMPDMGPHGAAYMLAFSVIALAGVKYYGFVEWKKEKEKK